MKYTAYVNGQLALTSDNISKCVNSITNNISNDTIGGWNNYFKNNHGHIVNNEEVSVVWSSRVYNNKLI